MSVANFGDSLGETVILVDEVDLLVQRQPWTSPDVNVASVWGHMSVYFGIFGVYLGLRAHQSLHMLRIVVFAPVEKLKVSKYCYGN